MDPIIKLRISNLQSVYSSVIQRRGLRDYTWISLGGNSLLTTTEKDYKFGKCKKDYCREEEAIII